MKVHVKVSGSGSNMFSGGSTTVETRISASDHAVNPTDLLAALTVSATTIANALTGGGSDGDDEAVGTTSEDYTEPRADDGAKPGDAVRLTWPEGDSRVAIRTEFGYEAPALPSRSFPDALEITDDMAHLSGVRVQVVAPLGETHGG